MDNEAYAQAKLEKENVLLKAAKENGNDIVGDKYFLGQDEAELTRLRNEINYKAEHLLFSLCDPLSDRIALSLAMSGGETD
jgi:hypothetical protein